MLVLSKVFEDQEFLEFGDNFQTVLQIFSKIVFFSSYSEYSTYFYNLDNVCRKFFSQIFVFVFVESNKEAYVALFLKHLDYLLKGNIRNEKSNQVSTNLLEIICSQLVGKVEQISVIYFQQLVDHLFLVKDLVQDKEYNQIIKKQEDSVYFALYKKFFPIVEKTILTNEESVFMGLQVARKNFFLFSHPKNSQHGMESFIKQEDHICKEIVKFFLSQMRLKQFQEGTMDLIFEFVQHYCQAISASGF